MALQPIQVEHLTKRYRLGANTYIHDTLRDQIASVAGLIFHRKRGQQTERDEILALDDVSFSIEQGEVVGIIGTNGAGKSTLLKVLSRITEPTSGRAVVRGRVRSLLEVGTGFHPELTGRENLYLNGAILGMKKVEINRQFDEIVDFSGIERFIDTPVKRYSTGMGVRLAFAIAAHLESEILLVDEVLAVGDFEFQKKCLGKMGDIAKEGRTIVFVSHNMHSLQNLCTAGILLESGRLALQGDIKDVMSRYLAGGGGTSGEVSWASPDVAPGDQNVRLKAVRIVSEENISGEVDIAKDFRVEVEYWNLRPGGHRMVSVHLNNSIGVSILTSGNLPSASLTPDPWYLRPYPTGVFRTACTIPGNFLNDGLHSVSAFIAGSVGQDNMVAEQNVLSFIVRDSGAMRKEYTGNWIGAVRPRLNWETEQMK